MLLQITTAERHPVGYKGLRDALRALPDRGQTEVRLYFAVTADRFRFFKKQKITGAPNEPDPDSLVPMVKQFALKVV